MLKEYQLLYLDNDISINRSFYCNNGDIKSRGLEVHVLDNSQAKDCTGLTLKMIIKVPSGELFETTVANGLVTVLNAATGIYQILFPNNMGKGRLIAEIQLSNAVPEVIVSRKFSIVGDGSLTSDGSISVLPQGGLLWNVLTNEAQRQADFDAVFANIEPAVAEKYTGLETEYATDLTDVKSQLAERATKAELSGVATPIAKSLVSDFTDTSRIYVYTGIEVGYTAGHWYFYNGASWVSGGVYQSSAIAKESVSPEKTTFIKNENLNLFDGNFLGLYLTGTVSSGYLTLLKNTAYQAIAMDIEPSTQYSVLKENIPNEADGNYYYKAVTFKRSKASVLADLESGNQISDGIIVVGNTSTTTTVHRFTSGVNDRSLFLVVSKIQSPYVEILKGDYITPIFNTYAPKYVPKDIEIYSKNEVNALMSDTPKIRVVSQVDGTILILYPAKSGNYVGYQYGLYTNAGINVNVWRLIETNVYDSSLAILYEICPDWADMEGVLKINGETDYIGSVHGDEQFVSAYLFLDDIQTELTATIDGYYKSAEFVVSSNIYHQDGGALAFTKTKSTKFEADGVNVSNHWTAKENLTLFHVRACLLSINKYSGATKLIDTYRDSHVVVMPTAVPVVSGNTTNLVQNVRMTDWMCNGLINAKLKLIDRDGSTLNGAELVDFGSRLKPYVDGFVGQAVVLNQVIYCQSHFLITTV